MNAGGTATNVTLKQGGALVTSTAATVTGSNRLGNFTVENGKADGVVLESGGRLDVLEGHSAQKTRVDDGGILIAWLQDNIDCESGIIFDNDEDKTDSAALLPCIEQAREDVRTLRHLQLLHQNR